MKKRNVLAMILLTTSLLLGACGQKTETTEETEEKSATAHETVTISYGLWGEEDRFTYTQAQIAAFEKEYPYITVSLNYTTWDNINDQIDSIMADGRASDVMQINYNWLNEYCTDGSGFYDMNELSDSIDFSAYSELSLSLGQVSGKQLALPIAMNTTVPIYNKTMYDYYDLEIPETIADLYADAEIMRGDGVYQLGMKDNMIVLFLFGCYENTYGVSAFNGEGRLNLKDEGYAYLATTYKDLQDSAIICPRSIYTETRIEGNRVAGVVSWINSIDTYKGIITDAGNDPYVGKFFWTDTDERLGNYYKPATMLAISANSNHPQEAALLVNYLLNDETAVQFQGVEKGVPDSRYAQQTLMEEGALNNDVYYSTLRMNYYMEYMHLLPEKLENNDFITTFLDTLDAYAEGSATLEETVLALKAI